MKTIINWTSKFANAGLKVPSLWFPYVAPSSVCPELAAAETGQMPGATFRHWMLYYETILLGLEDFQGKSTEIGSGGLYALSILRERIPREVPEWLQTDIVYGIQYFLAKRGVVIENIDLVYYNESGQKANFEDLLKWPGGQALLTSIRKESRTAGMQWYKEQSQATGYGLCPGPLFPHPRI